VTQGPDGHEEPADRVSVDSKDFLWIYVEAKLPSGSPPLGEYYEIVDGKPRQNTPIRLDPPKLISGQYRFSVIHYVLSERRKYLFHFADDLSTPNYEDRWEIATI